MPRSTPSRAARAAPGRVRVAVSVAVVAAILAIWAWSRLGAAVPPASVPADRAELIARRISVAAEDTARVWRRLLRAEAGRGYAPPTLALFVRETPTPCAGAGLAAGPFYCRASGTAAFDLAFLDDLGARLRRGVELGTALVVARVMAAHVRGELGMPETEDLELAALQADCLTGVWAAVAAEGLGPVPVGFYAELLRIGRNVGQDQAQTGPGTPAALDAFAPGRLAAREAAFAAGYARGELAACPPRAAPGG